MKATIFFIFLVFSLNATSLPILQNKHFEVTKNQPLQVQLGQSSTQFLYKILAYPIHGSLVQSAHIIEYTPHNNFVGMDTITFQVEDSDESSNAARITFSITDENVNTYQLSVNDFQHSNVHIYGTHVNDAEDSTPRTPNFDHVSPGDRIILPNTTRDVSLRIWGLQGTVDRPIVIINSVNGASQFTGYTNVLFEAVKHVQFLGVGDENTDYGMNITSPFPQTDGRGIRIGKAYVEYLEIGFISITNKDIGMLVLPAYPVENLPIFDNLSIHNNQLTNINEEGFYIGKAATEGDYGTLTNLTVNDNRLHNIGYESIQLRGLRGKNNNIHNNHISLSGWNYQPGVPNDMHSIFGLDIQNVNIYNNFIYQSEQSGIYLNDSQLHNDSDFSVYNNVILESGRASSGVSNNKPFGILIASAQDANVYNNTISGAILNGIHYYNELASGRFVNNIVTEIEDFQSAIGGHYNPNIIIDNNFYEPDESNVGFVNTNLLNYKVKATESEIVDAVRDDIGLQYDILFAHRPTGKSNDLGAYENTQPVSFNHQHEVGPGQTISINTGAIDLENDHLFHSIITEPTKGIALIVNDTIIYSACSDSSGSDIIEYRVFDGNHYSNIFTIELNITDLIFSDGFDNNDN